MEILGWHRDKKPEMKCRMCGTTENPCIIYEHDMLCRKCFDEIIPLTAKTKKE